MSNNNSDFDNPVIKQKLKSFLVSFLKHPSCKELNKFGSYHWSSVVMIDPCMTYFYLFNVPDIFICSCKSTLYPPLFCPRTLASMAFLALWHPAVFD